MRQSRDRRQFVLSSLSGAVFATPVASFLLNACKTANRRQLTSDLNDYSPAVTSAAADAAHITLRKSATDPSNAGNVELYRKAVAAMKATTFPIKSEGEDISWWEAHAEIHNNYCPHGNWFFLPWHRGYLHYFEKVCRAFCGDDSFALPYWDWSDDDRLPDSFTSGNEETNALFNNTRSIAPGERLNVPQVTQENVNSLLVITDIFMFMGEPSDNPRPAEKDRHLGKPGRLESRPHNKVHATIQGDMGAFTSPRDPIFWLHHCNVDRIWTRWVAERVAKKQMYLPPEKSKVEANRTTEYPWYGYWANHKIEGYYSISKEGDKFLANPVSFYVKEVHEAINMGLAYQPYTSPTKVEPPLVPNTPAVPSVVVPPTAQVIPAPLTPAAKDAQLSPVVDKEIPISAAPVASTQLLAGNSITLKIPFTPALGAALEAASIDRKNNKEATLRLGVSNIPFPSDPGADLIFYLNSTNPTGEEKNIEYIDSTSFFGHGHGGEKAAACMDLVATVKRLTKAGRKPFGSNQPLLITAVWKTKGQPDDLTGLKVSLTYVELG